MQTYNMEGEREREIGKENMCALNTENPRCTEGAKHKPRYSEGALYIYALFSQKLQISTTL